MTRAILRSIAIAAATLLVGGAGDALWLFAFCPRHHAWQRVHDQRSPVVVSSSYAVARPGDAVYSCTTPHRVATIAIHEDLDCYCAPAPFDARTLGARIGGDCALDNAHPTRDDDFGACRHAGCGEHVDP